MLALLLACRLPPDDVPAAATCAEGELRTSDGSLHDTLADAVDAAESWDAICLGAGTFSIGEACVEQTGTSSSGRRLAITGAGPDATVVRGSASGCLDLNVVFTGEGDVLTVEGLTLRDAQVDLAAPELRIADVRITGEHGSGWPALWAEGDAATIARVEIIENEADYASGFLFRGAGTLTDVDVRANRFAEGYFGTIYDGPWTWTGGAVRDNLRTVEQPNGGYDFLEVDATITMEGVAFDDNRTNGPLLTVYGALQGIELSFDDNEGNGRAVLTVEGSATLAGGDFEANLGGEGILGLYQVDATLTLDGVDMGEGEDDNVGCEVFAMGSCLEGDLGEEATTVCHVAGCG